MGRKTCRRCGQLYDSRANKYCDPCKPLAYAEAQGKWSKEHPTKRAELYRQRDAKRQQDPLYLERKAKRSRRLYLLKHPLAKRRDEESRHSRHGQLRCSRCRQFKPIGNFARNGIYKDGRPKRHAHCKLCQRPKNNLNEARRRNAEGTFDHIDIDNLKELQRMRCAICSTSLWAAGFHIDHKQPISKGGTNWPHNLQLLCPKCNLSKGASWNPP